MINAFTRITEIKLILKKTGLNFLQFWDKKPAL